MKKPRPTRKIGRKRRITGWTLLTIGVLVAGLWVSSAWRTWRIESGRFAVWLGGGTASLDREGGLNTSTPFRIQLIDEPMFSRLAWRIQKGWPTRAFMSFDYPVGWPFQNDLGLIGYVGSQITAETFEYRSWRIALWPLPLLLCTPAALLLRSGLLARRRALTGKCKKCGYDLSGLTPNAPCPECGQSATIPSVPT